MRLTFFGVTLLFASSFSAYAATGWTQGFAQGTIVATVRAADGSVFGLYCAEGQLDRNLGIQLERANSKFPTKPYLTEVIVDGRHFLFTVNGVISIERTNSEKNQIMIMEDMMIKSHASKFKVRIDGSSWQQDFLLSGVKKALEGNRPTQLMTDDCTAP